MSKRINEFEVVKGGGKRSLVPVSWECKLVQLLWETAMWRFLKILKMKLPYELAILLQIIYQKNTKRLI